MDQHFEWHAHEPAALRAGLQPAIIDVVRHRKPVDGLGEKEATLIRLGREAIGKHKVSDETFDAGLRLFGKDLLLHYVSLIGLRRYRDFLLTVFDQHLPEGEEPPRSRRKGMQKALVLLLGLVLLSGSSAVVAQETVVMHADGPPNEGYKIIYYAAQSGLFRKYGLTVEPNIVNSGNAAMAALAGGAVDVAWTNLLPVLQCICAACHS